jgi:hypothetical protein
VARPDTNSTSSTLSQLPTCAFDTTAIVQRPDVTRVDTAMRIQTPSADTGNATRCSAPPQSRSARYAACCRPEERIHARAVNQPGDRPVSVCLVSTW